MTSPGISELTIEDLPADAVLLDVREDEEWAAGHAVGALHAPLSDLPARFDQPDVRDALEGSAPLVVVCKVGSRSAMVTQYLTQNGFDAHNLIGGMYAWQAAGRPMQSADGQPPSVI